MATKTPTNENPSKPKTTLKPAAKILKAATLKIEEVTVLEIDYLVQARKFVSRKKIHRRRDIPLVPVGENIEDNNPTRAMALSRPQAFASARAMRDSMTAAPMAATDNITLVKNVQLDDVATEDTASHVCEPSLATNGDVVFYTGNWFAAISVDGGSTFRFVDPTSMFPASLNHDFCCDQVVQYIKKIDTFVWLLQATEKADGENVQRLAMAKTSDVKIGKWRIYDITSKSVGMNGAWLDFPDMAVGTNMLYVTTNAFRGDDWVGTVLVRIPLASIKSGNITAQNTVSTTNFSFRVAQHCGTKAFWAAHEDTSTLRVYSWGETQAQPTFTDVTVATWVPSPYNSKTPDNRNWMDRADERLGGATKVGNQLWFAWISGKGGANNRPHPFIQIARINATTLNLLENINLWDPNLAVGYAALSTNTNREVGVSYMIGGATKFPTHVVGILTGTRKEVSTFASVRGPNDQKYGDYLTIRRHNPNGKLFSASGYTLQSGSGQSDATPNFTLFGRASDV